MQITLKEALGRKVLWTSPNTGRVYEGWVVRFFDGGQIAFRVAKDYTEYDFRLVEGNYIDTAKPDDLVTLIPAGHRPKWVRENS